MQKELSNLSFNMNKKMVDDIVKIISVKEKLDKLDENSEEYKKQRALFNKLKFDLIKEFQLINVNEIENYLRIKNDT